MHRFSILLFLLISFSSFSFAQQLKRDSLSAAISKPIKSDGWFTHGLQLEVNYQFGQIFKHTHNFKPDTKGLDYAVELALHRQTFGAKAWNSSYHYPLTGITFIYNVFSNQDELGEALGVLAHVQFKVIQHKNLKFYFGMAEGMAYLTKKYDAVNDTINNVIGSHWNEATQFKAIVNWQINPNCNMRFFGSFIHFSNAKYTTPNLGINVYSAGIGLQYYLTKMPVNFRPMAQPLYNKHWKFNARLGFARNENQITGGFKYPYYIVYAGASKQVSHINRFTLGLWYEYNKGAKLTREFFNPEAADGLQVASKGALVVGDEFIFGKISLVGNVGVYVFQGGNKQFPAYQQLGIHYVLWTFNKAKQQQIYTGVQLKTHLGVAEYFDTFIAVRL